MSREKDPSRDLEALRMFRHPVPGRAPGRLVAKDGSRRNVSAGLSPVAALGLLVLIVGGAFWLAPTPPAIVFSVLDQPEHPVAHLPPGTPVRLTVDLRQDGFPGLFALGPDGYLRWLFPPERGPEPYHRARAGRRTYFETHGFRPELPGAWLFVHFLHDRPVTPSVQKAVVDALRLRRRWHHSPFEFAPELERILSSTFHEVIAQPYTAGP